MNDPAIIALSALRDAAIAEHAAMAASLRDLKNKIRSYEGAIAVLSEAPAVSDDREQTKVTLRDMILERVRAAADGTTSSKVAAELTAGGRSTGETTVSSIFSRLKGEGLIEKRDGLWIAIDKKTPDVSASGVFDDDGPGDGSRVESSQLAPEGSIPSRSTFVNQRPTAFDDDLNDDVPF